MPLDVVRFRQTMSQLATGVAVITVRTPRGGLGMTASSLSSLSLDPPLLLVCVGHEAAIHEPARTALGLLYERSHVGLLIGQF